MDWKKYYEDHKMSIKDAVLALPSDATMTTSHAASEPRALLQGICDYKEHFKGARLFSIVLMEDAPYCKPEMEGHLRYQTMFNSAGSRQAMKDKRADFVPVYYSDVPAYIKNHYKPNVVLIQVSEPDEHGYCSMGCCCDFQRAAIDTADYVVAQVNKKAPYVMGDNFVHVTELTHIVEETRDLPSLGAPKIGEIEEAIGRNCASLINDGDTLQLGIGAIPDAVLLSLKDKHDLGIHSEMFSDGVVELIDAGVVTNRKKNIDNGMSVATFLMGSQRLYDYIDHNPAVAMHPVDYTNNPLVACKNDNLISINSAIQVDLTGQVTAETIGTRQFSGAGGQVDFVRGANLSEGGKAIIAIPSTAGHGKISRIAPVMDLGSGVTTSRYEINYIVTEYGVASLTGKTLNERAEALIAIAHPDFRDELRKAWAER